MLYGSIWGMSAAAAAAMVTMFVHSISQLVSSYTSFWHNHLNRDPTIKDCWCSSPPKNIHKSPNTEPIKGNVLSGERCQAAYFKMVECNVLKDGDLEQKAASDIGRLKKDIVSFT